MMNELCRTEAANPQASSSTSAQSASMLAAWVGQLLEDVRRTHVARFQQLRPKLQSDAFAWDNALLTHSVQGWLAASRNLDFQLLRRRGFWARLTRGAEGAAREFGRTYEGVLSAAAKARQEFEMLSRDYRAHTSSERRLIVELDIESRALNREIDQGADWLVELSCTIEKADELRGFSTRAMALSGELKRLRAASTLGREITLLGQNVLERRTALLEMLKFDLHGFDKVWVQRLSNIRKKAVDRQVPLPALETAWEVHCELLTRLERTSAACLALQMEEQAMARRLAMLRGCLEGPATSVPAPLPSAFNF
jgi:hypothetical protein